MIWLYSINVLPGNILARCTNINAQGMVINVEAKTLIHTSCPAFVPEIVGASMSTAKMRLKTVIAKNCLPLIFPPSRTAKSKTLPSINYEPRLPVIFLPRRLRPLPGTLANVLFLDQGLGPGIHLPER